MELINNIQFKLILVTVVIYSIDVLSYSVRLVGIKTGKLAVSQSLFNIFALVSRTANMFQAPLIGAMIDVSIKSTFNPVYQVRNVLFAATVGTLFGMLLMPTFLQLFEKAVSRMDVAGSIPGLLFQALNAANIKRIAKSTKAPNKSMLMKLRFRNIPKRLILLNLFITGIHSVGVLAAYYAAIYVPAQRLAVSASSGMINGVATILFTLFVDPSSSIIIDEVQLKKRPYIDGVTLMAFLIGTKLLGTLLGQVFLVPAAKVIAHFYS